VTMTSAAPRERLDAATTIDEVVAAVRDYMEGWTILDRDRLPRFNRPAMVDDAEAIHRWADQLSRYEPSASQDPVNSELFVALRDCFVRASARIGHVSSGENRSG
jgi:hypothetical protein